jgi:hypothetical protein
MRRRGSRIGLTAAVAASVALVAAGCAGNKEAATGSVPASASLAPKDALAFVTIVSDEGSAQWRRADRLLRLFPKARESVVSEFERQLAAEGLTWDRDIAPAIGPEIVVVVTREHQVVALTKPDDANALQALLRKSDEPTVSEPVSDGWTAIAEKQEDIGAYRAAMAQGSLEDVDLFRDSFTALPSDAIARGWVDLRTVAKELTDALDSSSSGTEEIGVEDLAAAVSAEEDGVLLSVGVRTPDGTGTTSYEPKLLDDVPADAVLALSFGGTQGALDKVERTIDLEGISGAIGDAIGISFDRVLEALSGEGVFYVRDSGGDFPELTLVLDPPDADKTWADIETVAQKVAHEAGGTIDRGTRDGRPFDRIRLEGVTVVYGRIDADRLLVTTSEGALDDFLADGAKLTDGPAFVAAAERVDLGERTNGFAYVDLDGLIPFIEGVAGADSVPAEAREVLSALDSFILQSSSDGDRTRLSGFLRIPG